MQVTLKKKFENSSKKNILNSLLKCRKHCVENKNEDSFLDEKHTARKLTVTKRKLNFFYKKWYQNRNENSYRKVITTTKRAPNQAAKGE